MPPTRRQLDQVSGAGSDTCGLITRRMCAEAWDVAMLAPPVDSDGTSCCPLQATFDETSWCAGPSDASEGAGAKKAASRRGKLCRDDPWAGSRAGAAQSDFFTAAGRTRCPPGNPP